MNKELNQKYGDLKNSIKNLDSAIIAFSGGIDSTLVLKAAHDVLGSNAVAVTADSPSLPRSELDETKEIVKQIGARHIIINTKETENEEYLKNPGNRCYFCKTELYTKLKDVSSELKIENILNGTNLDDMGDYRTGLKAADEHRIISPLKDANLTKNDIRQIAKYLGLKAWDKPSSPCLSSRVPYGHQITMKKLEMIEKAESFLKSFGIKELRVRHFGDTARIDVKDYDKKIIDENINAIEIKFNEIGFSSILVSNFKSGSLNMVLNATS